MTPPPNILIVAYSGKGHVNPSLRFAHRLLNLGVHVTYCTSLSVIHRIPTQSIPHRLTFAPFSDGHDDGKHPTTPLQQFVSDFQTHGSRAVADIITHNSAQPFDCVVYTTVIPWAARVAKAHGIKSALLWCQSATILDIYYYYFCFNEYQTLISANNNNPTFPISLPGLPPLTVADLPSFLLSSCPKEHEFLVPVMKDHIDVLEISPIILVNTVRDIETESIQAVEKNLNFLPIGPLIPSDGILSNEKDSTEYSMGSDFFEKDEDDYYIEWLNAQPDSSVVYVSFGTIATFSMEQVEEIAVGLFESERPFLWVIRDEEQAEGVKRKLMEKQKQKLQKQMIVGWCSQTEVFSHRAVGCVVMHCGWNSTVEALVAGVPTVAFPQWSDQGTNAKMVEDVWGIGVRVMRREGDGIVEGKEIKRCVEMVMEDEGMKMNARKWKEVSRRVLNNGGQSDVNVQTFLHGIGNSVV